MNDYQEVVRVANLIMGCLLTYNLISDLYPSTREMQIKEMHEKLINVMVCSQNTDKRMSQKIVQDICLTVFHKGHMDPKIIENYAELNGYKIFWSRDGKNMFRIFPNTQLMKHASLEMIENAMSIAKILIKDLKGWKQSYEIEFQKKLKCMIDFARGKPRDSYTVHFECQCLAVMSAQTQIIEEYAKLNGYKIEWDANDPKLIGNFMILEEKDESVLELKGWKKQLEKAFDL